MWVGIMNSIASSTVFVLKKSRTKNSNNFYKGYAFFSLFAKNGSSESENPCKLIWIDFLDTYMDFNFSVKSDLTLFKMD